jgi:hypothetical protein
MYYLENESKVFAVTSISNVDVHATFENHSQQLRFTSTSARTHTALRANRMRHRAGESRFGKVAWIEEGR